MAFDGGCEDSEYQALCAPGHPEKCCCYSDCSFRCCAEDQVCQERSGPQCLSACASAADCEGDASLGFLCIDGACVPQTCGADSECARGFLCQEGACVRRPCTSNRDCEAGKVCSALQSCVLPIEGEPEPGCSSTGAGAAPSLLLAALTALLLTAARARRRRAR